MDHMTTAGRAAIRLHPGDVIDIAFYGRGAQRLRRIALARLWRETRRSAANGASTLAHAALWWCRGAAIPASRQHRAA